MHGYAVTGRSMLNIGAGSNDSKTDQSIFGGMFAIKGAGAMCKFMPHALPAAPSASVLPATHQDHDDQECDASLQL